MKSLIIRRVVVVVAAMGATLGLLSTPAHAESAPGCSDTFQVSSTGYIDVDGQRAASVKQFWSPKCQANFGYLYVWQSFRNSHPHSVWTVDVGVTYHGGQSGSDGGYFENTSGSDFWSGPFAGRGICTGVTGEFIFNGVAHIAGTGAACN
ncbi:hypothetical protein Lfu02_28100 [Longispora fulva]|uniref:Secreted protein n=1 Tax=Longispora fulva TaxID=619741 RepID=A0A8J7KHT1_9ACTN|nr:hypothetical protein [Longispora fulva]MBG6138945.1 hypothetical protein [Longispora fulva]GIG58438.1 hypothetical protein Lfu02_28100 [Longispora fulva]